MRRLLIEEDTSSDNSTLTSTSSTQEPIEQPIQSQSETSSLYNETGIVLGNGILSSAPGNYTWHSIDPEIDILNYLEVVSQNIPTQIVSEAPTTIEEPTVEITEVKFDYSSLIKYENNFYNYNYYVQSAINMGYELKKCFECTIELLGKQITIMWELPFIGFIYDTNTIIYSKYFYINDVLQSTIEIVELDNNYIKEVVRGINVTTVDNRILYNSIDKIFFSDFNFVCNVLPCTFIIIDKKPINTTDDYFVGIISTVQLVTSSDYPIITDGSINDLIQDELQLVENTLREYYHEDNYSIRKINSYNYEIAIKFDRITLTNTPGQQHIIRELYVFIDLIFDAVLLKFKMNHKIRGQRGILTNSEKVNDYRHSHLSNEGWFCTGETQFRNHLATLSSGFTKIDLDILFLLLNQYVAWESLEGGPYRRMSDIKPREQQISCISMEIWEDVFIYIMSNIEPYLNDLSIRLNSQKVINDIILFPEISFESLEDAITTMLQTSGRFTEPGNNLFCEKGTRYYNLIEFSDNEEEIVISERDTDSFFKGAIITQKIIKDIQVVSDKTDTTIVVNPYITAAVYNTLHELIYRQWKQTKS